MPTVFVKDVDRDLVEQIAVLTIDVGFGPFPNDGFGWQNKNVLQLLDRDMDPHSLSRAVTPNKKGFTALFVGPRLILQGHEKVERATLGVNRVGEVPNLKLLFRRRPKLG